MLKKAFVSLFLLCSFLVFANKPNKATYVYFSLNGESKIKVYKLDSESEKLTYVGDVATEGTPYPLVVNKQKTLLYSGNWVGGFRDGVGKIQSFRIDANTGLLSHLSTAETIDIPVHISLSKNEAYLLSISFGRNLIGTQGVDENGEIDGNLIEEITLSGSRNWPHMIKTNPKGNVVYATSMGGDAINQFSFDEENGLLTPLTPANFDVSKTLDGPRHFVYHPNLEIVYFSNELNHKILVSSHSDAGLEEDPIQIADLLTEEDNEKGIKTSDIHITPNGEFLYAAVRRPNNSVGTIVAYSVDSSTGKLTLIGRYETEKIVREFDVLPGGDFLIAAGEQSGNSILYKIEEDGSLTEKQNFVVGKRPLWVMAVEVSKSAE